jgi:hypothetical protein
LKTWASVASTRAVAIPISATTHRPEDRAGSADGQGDGHAGDVSRAHPGGQADAEGLERRDAALTLTRELNSWPSIRRK